MTRFQRTDNEAAYSEIKPERCPLHAAADDRAAKERRRIFMQEIPLPEELAAETPRPMFANRGARR